MRYVGHKGAAHLLVFFQRGGQLVEVVRQPEQFILAADRHAGGEIACSQAVGARHQTLDRGQHAARQQPGHRRRHRGRAATIIQLELPLLAIEVDVGIARQALDRVVSTQPTIWLL